MPARRARDMRGQRNANPARSAAVFVFVLSLLAPLFTPNAQAQEVPELGINSTAYIVLDATTGEVYAQRNADDQRAMASLTKVFTFIEAINRAPLDQEILITTDDIFKDTSTRVGFSPGEVFTVQDLLYGMMLPSGNDAAHALARGLGAQPGDANPDVGYERFVGWMNARIQAMGLENTQLVNPHGWGVPGHYSTAADLATFVRYAILFPEFLEITGTQSYTTANGYSFTNTNKLLSSYQFLIGGKTGYDDDAGYCLIEIARRDGMTMISVTLDGVAPDDWYDDNRVLLEYAFDTKAAREANGQVFDGDIRSYVDPGVTFLGGATADVNLFPPGAVATTLPTSVAAPTAAASPAASPIMPTPGSAGETPPDDEASTRGPTIAPPGASIALVVAVTIAIVFALLRGFDVARRNARRAAALRASSPASERETPDGDSGPIPERSAREAEYVAGVASSEPPAATGGVTDQLPSSDPSSPAPQRRKGGGLAARFAPRDLPAVAPPPAEDDHEEDARPEPEYVRPSSQRALEPPPVLSPTSSTPIADIPVPPAPAPAAFESPLLRDIVSQTPRPAAIDEDAALLEALAVGEADTDVAEPEDVTGETEQAPEAVEPLPLADEESMGLQKENQTGESGAILPPVVDDSTGN